MIALFFPSSHIRNFRDVFEKMVFPRTLKEKFTNVLKRKKVRTVKPYSFYRIINTMKKNKDDLHFMYLPSFGQILTILNHFFPFSPFFKFSLVLVCSTAVFSPFFFLSLFNSFAHQPFFRWNLNIKFRIFFVKKNRLKIHVCVKPTILYSFVVVHICVMLACALLFKCFPLFVAILFNVLLGYS